MIAAPGSAGRPVGWVLPVLVVAVPVGWHLVAVTRRRERLGRRWSGWRTAGILLGTVLFAAALSPRRVAAQHLGYLFEGAEMPFGLLIGHRLWFGRDR
jgi:uncharacterized membrane protein